MGFVLVLRFFLRGLLGFVFIGLFNVGEVGILEFILLFLWGLYV